MQVTRLTATVAAWVIIAANAFGTVAIAPTHSFIPGSS